MVQPFDYTTNTGNPLAALTQAYGQGMQIRSVQDAQAAAQAAAQKKAADEAELRAGMIATSNANTPLDFLEVRKKYPQFASVLSKEFTALDEVRQNATYDTGQRAFALLSSGPDGQAKAVESLLADADRFKNSNMPDMEQKARGLAEIVKVSPDARKAIGMTMAAINPDRWEKFGNAQASIGKAEKVEQETAAIAEQRPFDLRAKTADVATKEAKASVAAPMAALELEKAGWDIKALQNDMGIKRQNAQIAAINAAINREGNDLKRQELQLKVAELNDKVGTRVQERAAEGKSAQAQADILLSTTDRALRAAVGVDPKTNKLNIDPKTGQPRAFTGVVRDATGTIQSRLPTLDQDVADFETIIDTLGSQATMARLGEMKGVLSDRDLEVLRSSMGSLSLRQSPSALVSNLMTIQRLTNKAKAVTAERYGVPADATAGSGRRMRYNPATGRVE